MIHNIPQPTFEQFLADVLVKDPNVDLRKGVSFVSLEQVRGCYLIQHYHIDFGGSGHSDNHG